MKINFKNLHWLWLSLLVLIIDSMTKVLALKHLSFEQAVKIWPFFNLTLSFNRGAAFSLLNNASDWQQWFFGGIAIVVCTVLVVWLVRLESHRIRTASAISLIVGGAIGNLADRIQHGHVVDFVQLHIGHYYWPIFNMADSAIFLGAIILAIEIVVTPTTPTVPRT